jgi:lysozyme family protein
MRENLPRVLKLSTAHEAGYVNHPRDPGGPTNHGITIATLGAYLGRRATIEEVKTLSPAVASAIYIKNYWAPIRGDELWPGLDYAVFDFGINSGPSRAVKELQKLLRVGVDGNVGSKTLMALNGVNDREDFLRRYCAARLSFCKGLRTWSDFGRGWTRRITGIDPKGQYPKQLGVVGESLAMLKGLAPKGIDKAPDISTAKARDSETKLLTPTRNKVNATALAGTVAATATKLVDTLTPYGDTIKWVGIAISVLTAVAILAAMYLTLFKTQETAGPA